MISGMLSCGRSNIRERGEILRWRCILLLLLLCVSVGGTAEASEALPVQIAADTVTIGGTCIDSLLSDYPLLIYKDLTYLPLTWSMSRFMGLTTQWSEAEGLQLGRSGQRSAYEGNIGQLNRPGYTYTAEPISFPVCLNRQPLETGGDYPWLIFRDVVYMPLSWDLVVHTFQWDMSWDATTGLQLGLSDFFDADDAEAQLSALFIHQLLNEYRFSAGYQDEEGQLWLHGEMRPRYSENEGPMQLRLQCDADQLLWYKGVEMLSRFAWTLPLDLSAEAQYSQSGGRLAQYDQDASFAAHPLARWPLLIFAEAEALAGRRWQEQAGDYFALELSGATGLQKLTLHYDREARRIDELILNGADIDADGSLRAYNLSIRLEPIPEAIPYSIYAMSGSVFLEPLPLPDGGMILLVSDGRVYRVDRTGRLLWDFAAAPQLFGSALAANGNILIWSYQQLWCLSPYGELIWQRPMAVHNLDLAGSVVLVSQHFGEQMQWELIAADYGTTLFLFPEEITQVLYNGSRFIALGNEVLVLYDASGQEVQRMNLLDNYQPGSEAFFFEPQYNLLAAENGWIVVLQQGMQMSKLLFFDNDLGYRNEVSGFGGSTQVIPFDSIIYLYSGSDLFSWSPQRDLQLLQRHVSSLPRFLSDGSFISRGTQVAPYELVQWIDGFNQVAWRDQLPWASQYSGPVELSDEQLVVLAGRNLVSYNAKGQLLWRSLLVDFQSLPRTIRTDGQERTVIANEKQIYLVDDSGRIRWIFLLQ